MRKSIIVALLLLGGCAAGPAVEPPPPAFQPFSLLAFGDHGYDLDYLEADDRNPALTREQAIAKQRVEWLED